MKRARRFYNRLLILPFETLLAGLAVLGGGLALLHVGGVTSDALTKLIPHWLLNLVNAMYLISGLSMILGLGGDRSDIEGFGLITLATSTLIREVALIDIAGLSSPVIVGLLFNVMIIWACAVRLTTIVRKDSIIRTKFSKGKHRDELQ